MRRAALPHIIEAFDAESESDDERDDESDDESLVASILSQHIDDDDEDDNGDNNNSNNNDAHSPAQVSSSRTTFVDDLSLTSQTNDSLSITTGRRCGWVGH